MPNLLFKKHCSFVANIKLIFLHRGDGVFRDCLNFDLKTTAEEEEKNETSQNEQCVFKILYTL